MISRPAPLTEVPAPWRPLKGEGRRAFDVVAERLVRVRIIIDLDRVMLTMLCAEWAAYRRLLRDSRRHPGAQDLQVVVAETRTTLRDLASRFFLLDASRVNFAAINAAGEDLELNAIFGFQHPPRDASERNPPR